MEATNSSNYWTLIRELKKHSTCTHHLDIVAEYEHVGVYERPYGVCTCGKHGIVVHNIIRHKPTGKIVDPVGSSCIGYFSRELNTEFKTAHSKYIKTKRERIATEPVTFGMYRGKTFYQLAKDDPSYAAWLLTLNKYTTNRGNPCYSPDNKEIRRLLQKGIRDHS